MNWVRHGGSTTWFQTSRYCRAKVEFNSINWVRHGSSTTFETGIQQVWFVSWKVRRLAFLGLIGFSNFYKLEALFPRALVTGIKKKRFETSQQCWSKFYVLHFLFFKSRFNVIINQIHFNNFWGGLVVPGELIIGRRIISRTRGVSRLSWSDIFYDLQVDGL